MTVCPSRPCKPDDPHYRNATASRGLHGACSDAELTIVITSAPFPSDLTGVACGLWSVKRDATARLRFEFEVWFWVVATG